MTFKNVLTITMFRVDGTTESHAIARRHELDALFPALDDPQDLRTMPLPDGWAAFLDITVQRLNDPTLVNAAAERFVQTLFTKAGIEAEPKLFGDIALVSNFKADGSPQYPWLTRH